MLHDVSQTHPNVHTALRPNAQNFSRPPNHPHKPDAGYAWIIAVCGFILYLIVDGIAYNLGLVNSAWLSEFKQSEMATAWIGSIFYATPLLTAPITAHFVESFGCKSVTIASGLLSAFGFAFSSLTTSVQQLYVTVGVIAGFGMGAGYLVGILSVERWFEVRRTFAIGLVSAGTGFGTFIFPPVTQFLLDSYGWRETMFFFAGLVCLMSLVGCFIIEPRFFEIRVTSSVLEISPESTRWRGIFSHFSNVNFLLLALSTFSIYALYNVPIYFVVELLRPYGYTEAECAGFLSLIGFCLMAGMIGLGYLGDVTGLRVKHMNGFCVLACGLSMALMPTVASSGQMLAVACGIFGFSFASAYVLIPTIAELIVGVEQFPSALGLNFFVQGVGCLLGTPFASFIFEMFDSWKVSFEICGFMLALSSAFAFLIKLRKLH